jgi:predicted flap endonuclease-1-like 5' DNA nuclease
MEQLLLDNLWLIVILAAAAVAILYLLLRPRQRVRLTDSAPLRPHMVDSRKEANDIASGGAAATSDVAGEILSAPVHDHLGSGVGEIDDFQRMKGVGPKFAQMLKAHGFLRFEQLAKLTADEMARLDADLGPFRGRITRDRIVEQAAFLARGDEDGFQQQFGKL